MKCLFYTESVFVPRHGFNKSDSFNKYNNTNLDKFECFFLEMVLFLLRTIFNIYIFEYTNRALYKERRMLPSIIIEGIFYKWIIEPKIKISFINHVLLHFRMNSSTCNLDMAYGIK